MKKYLFISLLLLTSSLFGMEKEDNENPQPSDDFRAFLVNQALDQAVNELTKNSLERLLEGEDLETTIENYRRGQGRHAADNGDAPDYFSPENIRESCIKAFQEQAKR